MKAKPYDPRPDLADDSRLWDAVLISARKHDPDPEGKRSLFGLLHGLRCCGARLKWTTKGTLRLDYEPVIEHCGWTREELLNKWLLVHKSEIQQAFRYVEQTYRAMKARGKTNQSR